MPYEGQIVPAALKEGDREGYLRLKAELPATFLMLPSDFLKLAQDMISIPYRLLLRVGHAYEAPNEVSQRADIYAKDWTRFTFGSRIDPSMFSIRGIHRRMRMKANE